MSSLYASQGGAFGLPIVELRDDTGREAEDRWWRDYLQWELGVVEMLKRNFLQWCFFSIKDGDFHNDTEWAFHHNICIHACNVFSYSPTFPHPFSSLPFHIRNVLIPSTRIVYMRQTVRTQCIKSQNWHFVCISTRGSSSSQFTWLIVVWSWWKQQSWQTQNRSHGKIYCDQARIQLFIIVFI